MNKRIVIWCGSAPNQKALVRKIHKQFGVDGIVIDKKKVGQKKKHKQGFFYKLLNRIRFGKIDLAWSKLQQHYQQHYTNWPSVPILEVDTINSNEANEFTRTISPDLIVVSGTGLIKQAYLSLPVSTGIINLHTGLSPYVKGGPNCTNWCIANNDWHLIGNTIMWINAGIDTGNIITSETVDITKCNTLFSAHLTVMERAHELYLRAIKYVLQSQSPYISIPQKDIGDGNLFLSNMWTSEAKKQMLKNWKKRKKITLKASPQTISLP